MYKIGSTGPGGPTTSLHATATEAMLAILDLQQARVETVTITDAAELELSELQLATLVLMERLLAGADRAR